jgi:flavin reductase (DIM6/NTAB) family NADH-FMN oxidoreductase RutF
MISINPAEIPVPKMHHYFLDTIAPRPIAFASTIDNKGNPNLSPFSFFNAFGVNPTTLIFSPSRRGRDNTTKNTYENILEVPEVVINVVTYDIVQQASLSSTEYPRETNEFIKAGLTMQASEKIRPFRVKESPVHYECKVRDVIRTGDQGGAANLVICEVLLLHIDPEILREDGSVDPDKIRLVGRMGRDYYTRAYGEALFEVEKPIQKKGIGIDQLPERIRNSKILTGNELGMLGNLEKLPSEQEISDLKKTDTIRTILEHPDDMKTVLITLARRSLHEGKAYEALKILMI